MALNIDMDKVQESSGTGSNQVPNGPYICKIVSVNYQDKDNWGNDQDYMELVWDVADGDYKDGFSGRPDFTHTARISFNEKQLGYSKHMLNCISNSNQGFNATEAWKCVCDLSDPHHAQAVKAFEGKLFGANIVVFHKPNKSKNADRYPDATSEVIRGWYSVDEIKAGKDKDGHEIKPQPDQYKKGWSAEQANAGSVAADGSDSTAATIDVADDDLPF